MSVFHTHGDVCLAAAHFQNPNVSGRRQPGHTDLSHTCPPPGALKPRSPSRRGPSETPAAPAVRVALVPRAVEGAARSPVIFPRVASVSSVFPFVVSCFLIFALSLSTSRPPLSSFPLNVTQTKNEKRKKAQKNTAKFFNSWHRYSLSRCHVAVTQREANTF